MGETLKLYTPTRAVQAPIDLASCQWAVEAQEGMRQCRRRGVLPREDIRLCRQHARVAWTECEGCGTALTSDERAYPVEDEDGDLCWWCSECEHDALDFLCIQCRDYARTADQHRLLVVIDAKAVKSRQGVYLIVERPYYTAPMIGTGWLHPGALAYLGPIPAQMSPDPEEYVYPCGHLCGACIAAYPPDPVWARVAVWWG